MVQIIPPKPLGGLSRFVEGLNTSLSQSLPKYIEHGMLSQGLKKFEQDSSNLNPMQQLTRLSSIPGITPQMLESFGKLARQQAKGQALQRLDNRPAAFPTQAMQPAEKPASTVPSLTQPDIFEKVQEGYIPPTTPELELEAAQAFEKSPAFFENDPNKALQWAEQKAQREEARAAAIQKKHENLNAIQSNIVSRLQSHAKNLGVEIPPNVYSKVEDEAIQAAKPKSQGGKGLTEQQAMKDYGKKLDDISRDYKEIDSLGNWSLYGRRPSENVRIIKSLQKNFKERGDTENFADMLIARNKLSPMFSYSLADPVKDYPKINKEIESIKDLETIETIAGAAKNPLSKEKTLQISERLSNYLKNGGNPLSIAYELDRKGYDPQTWLDYVDEHREELNLRENQIRALNKPINVTTPLNDLWIKSGM